jgi:hypothetical protein
MATTIGPSNGRGFLEPISESLLHDRLGCARVNGDIVKSFRIAWAAYARNTGLPTGRSTSSEAPKQYACGSLDAVFHSGPRPAGHDSIIAPKRYDGVPLDSLTAAVVRLDDGQR